MNHYKAVILDIDGTLLDTFETNMLPLIRLIREELGQEWTLEQVRPFYWQAGHKTLRDLGFAEQDIVPLYDRWVEGVNSVENGNRPFAGIVEALDALQSAGMRMAVVSSKMRGQYDFDIRRQGLDGYMDAAVLAEDTTEHKPHPAPLLECLKRLELQPQEAIYIGDAVSDCLAALSAGMDFGFAAWSRVSPAQIEGATYRFDAPSDMIEQLCK